MKRMTLVLSTALVAGVVTAGCRAGNGLPGGEPLVVATTTVLGDVVRAIGDGRVRVEVLMPRGTDPHDFAASARQAAQLRDAALVVGNGLGLEAGLDAVLQAAEDDGAEVLRVGELLDPINYVTGEGERSLDPHVWMDPVRMMDAVDAIAAALEEHAAVEVAAAAKAYRDEIETLHHEIEQMVLQVPAARRKLVTNHFSLGYFADRYGFELLGTVIPAATTEAEISASQFAALADLIRRENVAVIFGSTTEPTKLADALTAEVGREVRVVELFTESLGGEGSGGATYTDMMRTDTRLIVENLGAG